MDHIKDFCSSAFEKVSEKLNRNYKINLIEPNEFKILLNRGIQDRYMENFLIARNQNGQKRT